MVATLKTEKRKCALWQFEPAQRAVTIAILSVRGRSSYREYTHTVHLFEDFTCENAHISLDVCTRNEQAQN
jgi:hypothetical protein